MPLPWASFVDGRTSRCGDRFCLRLPIILHNPVPCGTDGLLGDAHDATHVFVVHTHFVADGHSLDFDALIQNMAELQERIRNIAINL